MIIWNPHVNNAILPNQDDGSIKAVMSSETRHLLKICTKFHQG
jgi:hypothetical protein